MASDPELLQRYAQGGDETAFRELVRRHIDFVYAVAARHTGNPSRAEDVAQQVFVDFTRKARQLAGRQEIVGWLYLSARYASLRLVRAEARRQAREREAQVIEPLPEQPDWRRLRPVIDEALGRLGQGDRAVILLRYFRNLSYPEIARTLEANEDAVRRRASRALEKLRRALARNGAESSAEALAQALEAQPATPAPAGLAVVAGDAALAAWTAAQRASPGTIKWLQSLGQSGPLAAGLCIAALFVAGLAWHARAAARADQATLFAAQASNERMAGHRETANQAATTAQQAYDDLNRQYHAAERRAEAIRRANGPAISSTDPELQRWAIRRLNTLHAETDMPFLRRMGWPPEKIQTFLDYMAVASNVTGLKVDGVTITLRDDQYRLRNAVSDGGSEDNKSHPLEDWLGPDADKFDDFERHNNSYDIAGNVAEHLYGVAPLSADQAAALTQAFLSHGISIEPSVENWGKILAAGAGVLSPAQLEVVRQFGTAVTGEEFESPAP